MTANRPEPAPGPDPAPAIVPDPAPVPGPVQAPAAETKRPWLERIGLAAVALVMGALLTVMAIAAWTGGEWILSAMSASGALLTVGVGLLTLVRG